MRACWVLVVLASLWPAAAVAAPQKSGGAAQEKPPAAQGRPAPEPQRPGAPTPGADASVKPPPESYTYQPEGRRDPFVSLLGTGTAAASSSRKGEGVAGMSVNDISVRGVMESRGALIAMVQGPDNKTYIVHQGDQLLDGTIKSVTSQGLVVIQEVSDPLSLVKQREIHKLLRSLEDANK